MIQIKKKFLNNFIIDINKKISDGLKKIQDTKYNIIIAYKKNSFVGIIQGGDIRRKLISKVSLDGKLSEIYNKKCVYFYSNVKNLNYKLEQLKKSKSGIEGVPIINKKTKKLTNLFIFSKNYSFHNDYAVVVMAGGKGKRMKYLTKNTPKPLLKIKKKPIIEYTLDNIKKINFDSIFVTTKYHSSKVKNFLINYSKKINISIQEIKEKKFLGTAGCLKKIKERTNKKIILINGDLIVNLNYNDLLNHHELYKNDITICSKEDIFKVPYGLLKKNRNNNFFIEEKPNFILRFNIGIYVINSDVISLIKSNSTIDMPDFINLAQKKKYKIGQYNVIEKIKHFTIPEDLKQ